MISQVRALAPLASACIFSRRRRLLLRHLIAFAVELQGTCPPFVPPAPPPLGARSPPSLAAPRAQTPCGAGRGNPFASTLPRTRLVRTERDARTHMGAASAVSIATGLGDAPTLPAGELPVPPHPPLDPRRVVTPIDVDHLEHLLASLGLQEQSARVLDGLRKGFDIGARSPISRTLIYKNHASAELVCAI